jgi:hypothetical protein
MKKSKLLLLLILSLMILSCVEANTQEAIAIEIEIDTTPEIVIVRPNSYIFEGPKSKIKLMAIKKTSSDDLSAIFLFSDINGWTKEVLEIDDSFYLEFYDIDSVLTEVKFIGTTDGGLGIFEFKRMPRD